MGFISIAQMLFVELEIFADDSIEGQLALGEGAPLPSHGNTQFAVLDESARRFRQRVAVARRHEQTGFTVAHEFAAAGNVGGDDRLAAGGPPRPHARRALPGTRQPNYVSP